MGLNSFVSNQGTQTAILTDNTGGTAGTVIAVQKVDISPQGTAGTIWNGNVGVNGGTINTIGTLPNITIAGGTVSVNELSGTLNVATITALPNLPGGTLTSIGTLVGAGTVTNIGSVTNIGQLYNAGTIQGGSIVVTTGTILSSGTTTGVGSVSNMGSLGVLNAGTITTLPNLPGGTINILANGTLSSSGTTTGVGTVTGIGQINNAGTLQAGTVNLGTIVGKVASGVAASANPVQVAGTDSGGTIYGMRVDSSGVISSRGAGDYTAGADGESNTAPGFQDFNGNAQYPHVHGYVFNGSTWDRMRGGTDGVITRMNPLPVTNTISHAGTAGTTAIGTLVGSATVGAGTALYPTNYRIIAISGTPEVILAFGSVTNGAQVIHHGLYPAGGGIASPISYPHGYGTTNAPLTYQILSGSGTVSWDVDYFLHT